VDANIKLEEDAAEGDDDCSEQGFINASQLNPIQLDKAEKAELRKKRAELAALGEWTHINGLRRHVRHDVHDDVLRRILYFAGDDDMDQVNPQSRLDSLLTLVDLENVAAMDEKHSLPSVRDVPGGTVCFLFEKISTSSLDEAGTKAGQRA